MGHVSNSSVSCNAKEWDKSMIWTKLFQMNDWNGLNSPDRDVNESPWLVYPIDCLPFIMWYLFTIQIPPNGFSMTTTIILDHLQSPKYRMYSLFTIAVQRHGK